MSDSRKKNASNTSSTTSIFKKINQIFHKKEVSKTSFSQASQAVTRPVLAAQNQAKSPNNPAHEFMINQEIFHRNMQILVDALMNQERLKSQIDTQLSTEDSVKLQAFLRPFIELTRNPFNTNQTATHEVEISRGIIRGIKSKNDFSQTWQQLVKVTFDAEAFQAFLQDLKMRNPRGYQAIAQAILTSTSAKGAPLENFLSRPYQHLMRYEMTLKEEAKSLTKQNADPSVISQLNQTVQMLQSANQINNDNIKFLKLLNEMNEALKPLILAARVGHERIQIQKDPVIARIHQLIERGKNELSANNPLSSSSATSSEMTRTTLLQEINQVLANAKRGSLKAISADISALEKQYAERMKPLVSTESKKEEKITISPLKPH